jgi:hypothetical protein
MSDIYSVLSSGYRSVGALTSTSKTPYKAVDASLYEGRWDGTYANKQRFTVTVSDVTGFRAKVRYQSGATVKYQDVLIRDNAFRIGDTKFTLMAQGKAQIKTVVTNGDGTSRLDTAYAHQNT